MESFLFPIKTFNEEDNLSSFVHLCPHMPSLNIDLFMAQLPAPLQIISSILKNSHDPQQLITHHRKFAKKMKQLKQICRHLLEKSPLERKQEILAYLELLNLLDSLEEAAFRWKETLKGQVNEHPHQAVMLNFIKELNDLLKNKIISSMIIENIKNEVEKLNSLKEKELDNWLQKTAYDRFVWFCEKTRDFAFEYQKTHLLKN